MIASALVLILASAVVNLLAIPSSPTTATTLFTPASANLLLRSASDAIVVSTPSTKNLSSALYVYEAPVVVPACFNTT